MNGAVAYVPGGLAVEDLPQTGLPRSGLTSREVLIWVAVLFGASAASTIGVAALSGVAGKASLSAVELIAWGCALQIMVREKGRESAPALQAGVMLLVAVAAALGGGKLVYPAALVIGALVTWARGWSRAERRFGLIFLAVATYRLLPKVILVVFGDLILRLDTAAAGILLTFVEPGSTWSGDVIRPPNDIGITVAIGCSSFANLSLVTLCYTSMALLDDARWSRRNVAAIFGVYLVVIALNTWRLMLMARSLAAYEYWHNGSGAEIFGVGLSLATVGLCSVGSRWANAR